VEGDDVFFAEPDVGSVADHAEVDAVHALTEFFDARPAQVFFSRQVEVLFERRFFHWVTNRALRELASQGFLRTEVRPLAAAGGSVHLYWHHRYRYPKRDANRVVGLINDYSGHPMGHAVGWQGEQLVLEGFARNRFVLIGRNVNALDSATWTESAHNMDLAVERDGLRYGIEVKNTLPYMDHKELDVKIRLCAHLGITPVFVVRMLPKTWINEVRLAGGFSLILEWQLYPLTHVGLARRVRAEFGLPVDTPKALEQGTMQRFITWHERRAR
jgi:hypothetical protein